MTSLLALWNQSVRADAAEIAARAEKECGICHGKGGVSEKLSIPSIGGFSNSAILDLLTTYENDPRKARRVLLMTVRKPI